MNIIDAVIIILLLIGFGLGISRGVIKQAIILIGIFIVAYLSYFLKNPIARFCYEKFPFIDFKFFGAASVVNILFYEVISFIFIFSLLLIVFKIIIKITGIIQKIFDFTVILGLISRILGAVLGIIEMYAITFILLFFFNQPFLRITGVEKSKYGEYILNNTPILTNTVKGAVDVIGDIYKLKDNYLDKDFEKSSIEKFLKYNITEAKSLKILKDKNKLKFDGLDELINKYGGNDENIREE